MLRSGYLYQLIRKYGAQYIKAKLISGSSKVVCKVLFFSIYCVCIEWFENSWKKSFIKNVEYENTKHAKTASILLLSSFEMKIEKKIDQIVKDFQDQKNDIRSILIAYIAKKKHTAKKNISRGNNISRKKKDLKKFKIRWEKKRKSKKIQNSMRKRTKE